MFHIGVPEFLLILAIVLLIFGAGKLPEVGRAMGQALSELRRSSREKEGKNDHIPALEAPEKEHREA
ncbi:MAG: twin-arginine translocase TatA/TatE family subunit [Bacillota bacterium]